MRVVAVLVIRGFNGAKVRMASILRASERADLARAMFEDVLGVVQRSHLDDIVVVSPDPEALLLAGLKGAKCIPETSPRGMNSAFQESLEYCRETKTDLMICVPCDLPLLEEEDIRFMVAKAGVGSKVVLSPSEGSAGTSLLAMNPPGVIPFRFEEDSYILHVQEAESRGIPFLVYDRPSASVDVDEPKDLQAVLLSPKDGETKRLLLRLGVPKRLKSLGE